MQAPNEGVIPTRDGIARVFRPRYNLPALAHVSMSVPSGSCIKVCTVGMRPFNERCIGYGCTHS